MINELFEQQGSFDIKLRSDSLRLYESLASYGHIVITPQEMNPDLFDDAAILSKARYSGVVLDKEYSNGVISVSGAGVVWWLGDQDGVGDLLEAGVNLSASTLSASIAALLPSAVTSGTVTNTGVGTYTAFHQWETSLSAIRTVMQTLNCHFKVQPDGTLDSCLVTAADNVNPYVMNDPRVVIVRKGWGDDPSYTSVPARSLVSREDARKYATRAVLVDFDANEIGSLNAAEDVSPATSYKDIHGNAMVRTYMASRPASEDISLDLFLSTELTARSIEKRQEVDTEHYEITGGTLGVGDTFLVYDPSSGFVDKTNEIIFRGRPIWPEQSRLLEGSWSLKSGMGVTYRDLNGVHKNLTRWIDWSRS